MLSVASVKSDVRFMNDIMLKILMKMKKIMR